MSEDDARPNETEGTEYDVDFRAEPERYRVERGEQGAFNVEPYESDETYTAQREAWRDRYG